MGGVFKCQTDSVQRQKFFTLKKTLLTTYNMIQYTTIVQTLQRSHYVRSLQKS